METSQRKISKQFTVLVIDDNNILLRTVKEMLDEKFNVSIAISSTQAFESIQRRLPNLILLDYEMPYVDGEEVLLQLRQRNDTKDIPVIFLTGSADKDIVTKLVSMKPAGYVLKPPNKQKLIDFIEKTLTKGND